MTLGSVQLVLAMPAPAGVVAAATAAFVEHFPEGTIDVIIDGSDLRGDGQLLEREVRGKAIVFRLPAASENE